MTQNKIIIGLTGPTGAGKSTVSGFLCEKGVLVLDGDLISREVTAVGSPCLKELTEAFSSDILFEDGSLDRKKLGSIAFSDSRALLLLNRITHKYITAEISVRIEKSTEKIICIDAAALYESGLDRICDTVWVVMADEAQRKERIMSRDRLSEEEAMKRIRAQKIDYLAQNATVILNNHDAETLCKKVADLLLKLEEVNG